MWKKKAIAKPWNANKENEAVISIDELKFIFEQAEKQLKKTIDINPIIVARTTTLVTFVSGILVALISYNISRIITAVIPVPTYSDIKFDSITAMSFVCFVYLMILNIALFYNIKSRSYFQTGSEPKALFVDNFFVIEDEKVRLKYFYLTEIENYQLRINKNKKINERRWKMFNTSLVLVMLTPIVLLITFAIFSCRNSPKPCPHSSCYLSKCQVLR